MTSTSRAGWTRCRRWSSLVPLREVTRENAHLAKRDASDEVAALKRARQGHHDPNGKRLTRSLLEARLVDEFNIAVAPVVLGGGRPLFAGLKQWLDGHQTKFSRFDNGTIFLRYEMKTRVARLRE